MEDIFTLVLHRRAGGQTGDVVAAAHGFLGALSEVLADTQKTEQLVSSFVKTDEKTGARHIVIPPDIEQAALRALDALTAILKKPNA